MIKQNLISIIGSKLKKECKWQDDSKQWWLNKQVLMSGVVIIQFFN